jgi:hypothetical protein
MSFPFGGHPTLQQFVEFAGQNGCSITVSADTAPSGKVYQTLRINRDTGAGVIIVDPDFRGFLAPSTVTYYQRRLGIRAPFAVSPEQTYTPDANISDGN